MKEMHRQNWHQHAWTHHHLWVCPTQGTQNLVADHTIKMPLMGASQLKFMILQLVMYHPVGDVH